MNTFSPALHIWVTPFEESNMQNDKQVSDTLFPVLDIILYEFPRCAGWAEEKSGAKYQIKRLVLWGHAYMTSAQGGGGVKPKKCEDCTDRLRERKYDRREGV